MKYATVVAMVFLLLTLNIFHTFFNVSVVNFEQVNGWTQLVNRKRSTHFWYIVIADNYV